MGRGETEDNGPWRYTKCYIRQLPGGAAVRPATFQQPFGYQSTSTKSMNRRSTENLPDPSALEGLAPLHSLLSEGFRFDCEFQGGLSNHLPMVLAALFRLGASIDRLAWFHAHYSPRLVVLSNHEPNTRVVIDEDFTKRLGERDAYSFYRAFFGQHVPSTGASFHDVLSRFIPLLMPGCGAAAFHPMIRLAYALQVAHRDEIVDSLAYWACRYLCLDPTAPPPPSATPPRLIFQRMQHVARTKEFTEALAAIKAAADPRAELERLGRNAARLYAQSPNFTVLHLVTSAHALRVLWPHITDHSAALAHYSRAYLAGAMTTDLTLKDVDKLQPSVPLIPWGECVASALSSDDDHLIKLVYTCREEHAAYGGAEWHQAASRIVMDARASAL